jgi:hypothetical protein
MSRAISAGSVYEVAQIKQLDRTELECQPNDVPAVCVGHLLNNLLQPIRHWPDKHLAEALRTADDVVYDQVDTMLLVLVLQVAIVSFFTTVCTSERPFLPWLKTGGFLAHFL